MVAKYLLVYHGGSMPESQEEIDATMARWGKWMEDNGPSLVDPGNPSNSYLLNKLEGDTVLATAYALLALERLYPGL